MADPAKPSDFIIYQEQMASGMAERAAVVADIFNERSNGAIILDVADMVGDFNQTSFFPLIADLVTRQDITSVAAATSVAPTQEEFIGVKVNQIIGPIDYTLNALRRIKSKLTPEAYSIILGEQIADAVLQRMVTVGVKALVGAITGNSGALLDLSTTEKLNAINMIRGKALFGDASEKIVCWLTHSIPWFDLLQSQAAEGLDTVSGMVFMNGTPATGGVPMLKTDNASLVNSAKYYNLGLVEGALIITKTEVEQMVMEWVTGLKQLVYRTQGELAFNVSIKGFQWDTANGGINPTDAAIATTTNWDQIATSDKDTAGICVYTL